MSEMLLVFTIEATYLNEQSAKKWDLFPFTRNGNVLQWRSEDGFTYDRLRAVLPATTDILVTEMA